MASIARRPNGRWRPRYRDAAGKEHARHLEKKADAQAWLDSITTSVLTGAYVDPKRTDRDVSRAVGRLPRARRDAQVVGRALLVHRSRLPTPVASRPTR